MADRRSRVYYTKNQITTGLLTDGKEWMYVDGTEYRGQYHTYITGEVFTHSVYIDGKSRRLIPYVNIEKKDTVINGVSFNFGESFEYDSIKNIDIKASKIPNPYTPTPIADDYYKGYMLRYFAAKVNDYRLIEISKKDFSSAGSNGGLDKTLWHTFSLRWKVSGQLDDVLNQDGTIKQSGVISTNKRTIDLLSESYPSLKNILTNLTQFYQ